MIEDVHVPLQKISEITNRKLSFVRFLARNVDIEITNEHVSIDCALQLTKMLCIKTADTDEVHELREENKQLALDKQAHELAVEFLKSERKALKEKVQILERQLEQSEGRTDRFEASLLKMAESVSHLANNRDVLMGQMLWQSNWHIKQVGEKEVLVLSKPIKN
jgi:CII-binding regulator of phage lambda lysogenization HflD